jgi:hypothetical protein
MTENKIIILKRLIDEHFEKIDDSINPINKISKIIKKLKQNFNYFITALDPNLFKPLDPNLINVCFFKINDLITEEYQNQSTKLNTIKTEIEALQVLNNKWFANKKTINEKTNSISQLLFNNKYTEINSIVNNLLSYYTKINNDINDISKIYEIKKLLITDNPYFNYYIIEIRRLIINLNLTNNIDIKEIFILFEKYKQDDYKVDETNITNLIQKLNKIIEGRKCKDLKSNTINCVLVNYLKEIINLQSL